MHKDQYPVIARRRQTYDQLLWQTPVLSLTAQSFLLTIALGANNSAFAQITSALLSLITAVASIILMAKHRYYEVDASKRLKKFEEEHTAEGFEVIHDHKPHPSDNVSFIVQSSSFWIWIGVLGTFAIIASIIIIKQL